MATISALDFHLPAALGENGYRYDTDTSVWLPDGRPSSFSYSDGDAAEENLLQVIQNCIDVRNGSPALAAQIRDWTTEYHLSPLRANLLRPLSHLLQGDTLEIGAGCGALSRYIGELDGRLLAVEGSLRRASIAAARCKSLSNVSVLSDGVDSLQLQPRFDAVVLVGVVEYCQLFGEIPDPVRFLSLCRRFLKPGGCLILAIENKLGLKYLCGAPEDHLGAPYFGVEDRYSDDTPITWGRSELLAHLQSAGWSHVQELFPFPDYKLPQLVLTRHALSYGSVLRDLLSQYGPAADTGIQFHRSFSESAAWKVVAQNKLVPELANSFLLVASDTPLPEMEGAFVYSTNRHPALQCETRIHKFGKEFHVKKVPLHADSRPSTAKFKWSPSSSPFRHGRVYSGLLEAILLRPGWSYDEVIEWARPYFELLGSRAIEPTADANDAYLPGDQLDCGPHNLSLRDDGKLEDFDFEWISLHNLPLGYVFFRSLVHCLARLMAVAPSSHHEAGLLAGVRTVMSAFDLVTDDNILSDYFERESAMQSFVAGRPVVYTLPALEPRLLKPRAPSFAEVTQLRSGANELKSEITGVQASLHEERARTATLLAETAALLAEAAASRAETAASRVETTASRLETAAVRAETAALQADLRRISAELAQMHRDVQRLKPLEQQLLAEQANRAGVEHSLSWRVTKPLRAAAEFLRGHRPR